MKRQKMNLRDMDMHGIDFYAHQRVRDSKGNTGYRYILCNPLTDEQIKVVNSFKNTIVSTCHHRYAPEIRHDTLIILDKCKKSD